MDGLRLPALLLWTVLTVAARRNITPGPTCPLPSEVRDPWLADNWNISLMEGTFYELGYHDYTQPRRLCGCERSVKRVTAANATAGRNYSHINDQFSLFCQGQSYISPLAFNSTSQPAVLRGKCSLAPTGHCQDIVVDVGTRVAGELFPWVIEFQCVPSGPSGDALLFAGINFYSREKSEANLEAMIASAKAHGLEDFIDGGFIQGLTIVNHTNCTYPPLPPVP